MKISHCFAACIGLTFAIWPAAFAGTTIDTANRYAYGANPGWPPGSSSTTTCTFADSNALTRFYRVSAVLPLSP